MQKRMRGQWFRVERIAGLRRGARFKNVLLFLGVALLLNSTTCSAGSVALQLEEKIPLGHVAGRIDHLAVDLDRQRLFVAELGNDSVAVVDLKARKLLRRLSGFSHPQGVGYDKTTDLIFVANAGDGSVRLLRADDFLPAGRIALGTDADNVRVDVKAQRVYVGYGNGALAIIDPRTREKIGDIELKAHPESFQFDPTSSRIYANAPEAAQIAVLDRATRTQITAWSLARARANFPLAIDATGQHVLIASRRPPQLLAFHAPDGALVADVATCADADDVFIDPKRRRVYVSCGEGFIDIYARRGPSYKRIGHVATVRGARTSLFVPEYDRLFLAVRARVNQPAAIWVFRPLP